jgi:hypothetical protein
MARTVSDTRRAGSIRFAPAGSAVDFPTPDQIRLSIQQLVADERVDDAAHLADQSLAVYPESEGVLAISGLVAVVRNDWPRAVTLLERLVAIQGERASDFTRMMLERARACMGKSLPVGGQSLAADRGADC